MSPRIPETASAAQAEDITRSEQIMIFFLSCWSISTPMKRSPSTAWGRNPASVAKERTAADFALSGYIPYDCHLYNGAGTGSICPGRSANYEKLLSPCLQTAVPWFFPLPPLLLFHCQRYAVTCFLSVTWFFSVSWFLSDAYFLSAIYHPSSGIHIPSRSNISFSLRASSSVFFQPSRFHVHASLRRYQDLFLLQKHSLQVRMFK